MFISLIKAAKQLHERNPKASYAIGKELSLIELNLLWYPENTPDNVARLESLAEHIKRTFPNDSTASYLAFKLRILAAFIYAEFISENS
jgi:hypothetical protein